MPIESNWTKMDLEKDIHCFICFGVLPFGDVHRPFPQNPGFLEKFFQVNSQQFLENSLLCSKCDSHLTSMVDTSVKIQELQETLESLKAEFERNLIGGFELSQKTQKDINQRLGTNYEPGETLDTFYAGRCALVKDLNLIPTIISKIETSFPFKEFDFEDFEQVPSPAYEEPLDDPQEDLTPDLIVSQPIIGLKEAIVCLPRLELPPNQTRFNLNDLKSGLRPKKVIHCRKGSRGRTKKRIGRLNQATRGPGRPRMYNDEFHLRKIKYYEAFKIRAKKAEKKTPMNCTFEGCSYRSRFDFRMKKHIRLTHMKGLPKPEFKCPTCDFTAKWRSRLLIHQRMHQEIPSICDTCGKSYRNEASLKHHVSEQHSDPKSFLCSFCPKVFISKGRLNLHLKTHTRERVICDVCGKDFAIKRALDEHRQKEHEGKGVKCDICQKMLLNKQSYKQHLKSHSKTFEYKCPECSKYYNSNQALNVHIAVIHRDEKKFQCEICSKRFSRKGHYKSHMEATHKKEKIYACSSCPKTFFSLSLLRRHEEIHKNIKYPCPICNTVFNTTKYLSQHLNKTKCKDKFKAWKEDQDSSNYSSRNYLKDLAAPTELIE